MFDGEEIRFTINGYEIFVGETDGKTEVLISDLAFATNKVNIIKGENLGIRDFGRLRAVGYPGLPEINQGDICTVVNKTGTGRHKWFCAMADGHLSMLSEIGVQKSLRGFRNWVKDSGFTIEVAR